MSSFFSFLTLKNTAAIQAVENLRFKLSLNIFLMINKRFRELPTTENAQEMQNKANQPKESLIGEIAD